MGYCTVERIRQELPARVPPEITDPVIAGLIEEWSRYCDGYVAARYPLPLPLTPPQLEVATRMLVVHDLHVRLGLFRGEPNREHNLWAQAHKILEAIRDGKLPLVGLDGSGNETTPAPSGMPRVVSRDDYRGPMSLSSQARRFGRLPE